MTDSKTPAVVHPPSMLRGEIDDPKLSAALRTLELTVQRKLDGVLHGDHLGLIPGPDVIRLTVRDRDAKVRAVDLPADCPLSSRRLWDGLPPDWKQFVDTLPAFLDHLRVHGVCIHDNCDGLFPSNEQRSGQ